MGVWRIGPRPAKGSPTKVVKGRWVDIDKGKLYRSRYVAMEIKGGVKSAFAPEFFAAMPPLSSSKFLCNLAVTTYFPGQDGKLITIADPALIFIDVRRAHFVSWARRDIAVELPAELRKAGLDLVGFLEKAMYGTRDAAACWAGEVVRVFVLVLGFVQGKANPCHFFHMGKQIRASVHGDDVEGMASYCQLVWLKDALAKEWMIEYKGILAPPGRKDSIQEVSHLRRTLRWTDKGIEWEHDGKHIDRVIQFTGLAHGSKVTTPLVRERLEDGQDMYGTDTDLDIEPGEVTGYRSCSMTVAYVAQDRTDLQRTVRELAKGLSQPKQRHMMMLKRCARYLKFAPVLVQVFRYQPKFDTCDAYTDSDYAGCLRTRKSTTGVVIMYGVNQGRSLCRGQGVVALAVGEAEYYGLVTGACEAKGEQSFCFDLGCKLKVRIFMDSTTGICTGNRQGLGGMKHIHARFLWVQDETREKRLVILKVGTKDNFADLLTKPVTAETMNRLLGAMGFVVRQREVG